jgi:predicted nucleic acid-binding protein
MINGALSDFHGTTLYLDTMVFYALVRGIEPAARDLFRKIKTDQLQAYTSVITFDELAYRMIFTLAHEKYDKALQGQWKQRKNEIFTEFYPKILSSMTILRNFPNLTLLDVSAIDLMLMSENMARCILTPRDALHLSAMQKSGCFNLVSNNNAFDCVTEVHRYTLP